MQDGLRRTSVDAEHFGASSKSRVGGLIGENDHASIDPFEVKWKQTLPIEQFSADIVGLVVEVRVSVAALHGREKAREREVALSARLRA